MTEAKKAADHILMLNDVRIAFPQLWTPSQVQGEGKAAFSGSFLMPPEHPAIALVRAGITKVAQEKWGDKASEILKALIAGDKVCLHNGDTKAQYDGYAGNMFVSSRSPTRPLIIAQDRTPLVEADGKPYSGSYVNAQISLWAQDNKFGKRVNAQLRGVQFLRDGEAFGGGGVAAPDEFDEVVDESADAPAPTVNADDWGDLVT
jgi:hypothetical protein